MNETSLSYNYATHKYESWGVDASGRVVVISEQLELPLPVPIPPPDPGGLPQLDD